VLGLRRYGKGRKAYYPQFGLDALLNSNGGQRLQPPGERTTERRQTERSWVYAPTSALYSEARPTLSAFAISVAPTPLAFIGAHLVHINRDGPPLVDAFRLGSALEVTFAGVAIGGALQSRDRGMRHATSASDIRQGLAGFTARQRFLPLVWCQLGRPSHVNAASLRTKSTLAGASPDQLALKFRQATKHRQHQATVRCRGIGPGVSQRLEAGALLGDRVERVEQIAR
jgi:hypothetical protein